MEAVINAIIGRTTGAKYIHVAFEDLYTLSGAPRHLLGCMQAGHLTASANA